jgi:hypothetical protein
MSNGLAYGSVKLVDLVISEWHPESYESASICIFIIAEVG